MDIDPTKIKQTRTFLLENLNRMYPTPLQVRTLFKVLIGLDVNYTEELLAKDLNYCKQKGWIEYADEKIGGADKFINKFAGLTAKGKEMAEGTQSDPALEI